MAVNRHYSLAPNPADHPKYPNTVNQLIAGGGSVAGYQAGSTFKLFTMLAALESGKTLDTVFNAPSPLVSKYKATRPGHLRRLLVPGQRQSRRGWTATGQCGRRSAGRSTPTSSGWSSRSERSRRSPWHSGSASSSGRKATPRWPPTRAAGARSPWAWPIPPRSTWPTRTPPSPPAGIYCAPLPVNVDHRRGRPTRSRRRTRTAIRRSPRTSPPPRSTRPAARSASSRRSAPCDGGTATAVAGDPGQSAGRRQDRQLGAERDRDIRRVHPADRGRRHRRESGQSPRLRGQRGLAAGERRRRPYHGRCAAG